MLFASRNHGTCRELTELFRGQASYACVGIDMNKHEGVDEDTELAEHHDRYKLLQADVSDTQQVVLAFLAK